MEDKILALFAERGARPMTRRKMLETLNLPDNTEFKEALSALQARGALIGVGKDKYATPAMAGLESGIFRASGRGYGFVTREGGDVFIPPGACRDAWDGDTVLFTFLGDRSGRGPEGQVDRVLSRGRDLVTGRLVKTRRDAYIEPLDDRLPRRINLDRVPEYPEGHLVAASIVSYGDGKRAPHGKLLVSFGPAGTRQAACASVLYENGIPERFPDEVLAAALALHEPGDFTDRLDLRGRTVFTIDGAEAKDLDDAVSLDFDPSGRAVLGVHIADVSHYVQAGSTLDLDALSRGTSVYYADRVVPMLPERLSNGLCSLGPDRDKLTLSVFMTLSEEGKMQDTRFEKSVIRSCARMTYADCNLILQGDAALSARYDRLPLKEMNALAKTLKKARMSHGALDIDTVEGRILCSADGAPVDVLPAIRGDAERMIEEFMVCANQAVAEHLFYASFPAVYRVHDQPNPEKIAAFRAFAALKGVSMPAGESSPYALQSVLDRSHGKPYERVLSSMLLRSLPKAAYSEQNLGHFGLAARFYCHFTSPIRRYPDLITHRMLKAQLDGILPGARDEALCTQAARFSSQRELSADAAERACEKIYKAEFMASRIGLSYDGVVSGVQPFGVFVELYSTVEGLIPIGSLDGLWRFDEERLTLSGPGGLMLSPGDAVRVRCVGADIGSGRIDFQLVLDEPPAKLDNSGPIL